MTVWPATGGNVEQLMVQGGAGGLRRADVVDEFLLPLFRSVGVGEPYRWQGEAFERLLQGDVPGQIKVPTAAGKTMMLAVFVAALAACASVGDLRLPRRLVCTIKRLTRARQERGEELGSGYRQGGWHFRDQCWWSSPGSWRPVTKYHRGGESPSGSQFMPTTNRGNLSRTGKSMGRQVS